MKGAKKEAEIDWASEFGEEDEFKVEEHSSPEDGEDGEVEILLKENRDKPLETQKASMPTYSIRNGDRKISGALSAPATAPMSIGGARGTAVEQVVFTSTDGPPPPSSSTTSTSSFSSRPTFDRPMPRINLDTDQIVSPSPYDSFIELRNMSRTIKIIAVVHLMMSLVFVLFPTFKWMLLLNLGVSTVGMWGAFSYSARATLLFMALVCINVMMMVIFMLIELLNHTVQAGILGVGFLFLIGEMFIIHYCYQFWKKLPSEGFFNSFSQFFSSSESRVAGLTLDEEEGL